MVFSVFQKKLGFWVFLVNSTVVSVLLSAAVERCFVSRMQDFFFIKYFLRTGNPRYLGTTQGNNFFSLKIDSIWSVKDAKNLTKMDAKTCNVAFLESKTLVLKVRQLVFNSFIQFISKVIELYSQLQLSSRTK